MKNNPLDDLVRCSIEISSPASGDETFDSILVVVAPPGGTDGMVTDAEGKKSMSRVTAISQADELLDYGYTVNDPAYAAALVAFSQSPSPEELYICIRKEAENSGQDTAETETGTGEEPGAETQNAAGEEAGAGKEKTWENIQTTLSRAKEEAGFYGICLVGFRDPETVEGAVSWAEANEKLFAFEYLDPEACPVSNFSFYRSFGIYSGEADGYESANQPAENQYAALAWMAKCFGYDPGTETWNLKELASIVPSALSTARKKKLEEKHINSFRRYAGCNVTIGGYTLAGEWIDVIRFRDWLKAEIQINVFNALKTNRKVPYTDAGIGLIEGKMEETLLRGQAIGGIAGNEYDDGKLIPGFTVTVPRATSLTEAERKSRKLPGCRFTARLAGAIHAAEIEGYLSF